MRDAGARTPDRAPSSSPPSAGILGLQRTAGNAAVGQLLALRAPGRRPVRPAVAGPAAPVVQRAYWEKVGSEYTWHGGEEQPPKHYVKLPEAQKGNPNNKKKMYDVYGPPPPKVGSQKKGKKGGSGAVVQAPKVEGPKPLNKQQATTQAKKAPALLEAVEVDALLAASEMTKAATADLSIAAAKAAGDAAGRATTGAAALGELLAKVASFDALAADVGPHHVAALSAAEAAARFAAQAKRLADVVEAQKKVHDLAEKEEAEKAKLKAARELAAEHAENVSYLQGYLMAFTTDMALVGRSGFVPNIDMAGTRADIQLDIVAAAQAQREAEEAVQELEAALDALGKEKSTASDDVPVKEQAAVTGATGLPEAKVDLEATRALRGLAGGEVNLSSLLTLPKFAGDKAALKRYLDAVGGKGLEQPKVVQLVSDLSATRSEVELGTIATAIAGGADITIALALARIDPKVTAEHVALFAKVQKAALCKLQHVVDLLPARAVPLYASEVVLTELAVLAKDGTSATRMAEIIVAEPTLAKASLVELTNLFDDYPTRDEMLVLAKMVKEGMKAARTAANATKLIEDLNSGSVTLPSAADLKLLLQSAALAAFSMDQVAQLIAALSGLSGAQMIEVSTWLNPLPPADKVDLVRVFVADATPVLQIHGTFQLMNKAAMNGAAIRSKVEYLRGFLAAPGGDGDKSVTEVGGKKILTGPEIHAHATGALTGPTPQTKVGELNKYPKGENPATRNLDTLWLDANPTPRGAETAEEAVRRQKFAIAEICAKPNVIRENVQQLLAHNHGAAPRPIGLPAAEDALDPNGEAHTNDKHTIGGGGTINTPYNLAARACYSPTAGGESSAFKSPSAAKQGIQAALDAEVAAGGWPFLRERLSKGFAVAIDRPVGADKLVWLRTTGGGGPNGLYDRGGDNTFLNQAAKPRNDGGRGGRHYFPGDTGVIPKRTVPQQGTFVTWDAGNNSAFVTFGQPPARVPVEPGANLTVFVASTGVHARLIGMNADGGFVVNSAYAY